MPQWVCFAGVSVTTRVETRAGGDHRPSSAGGTSSSTLESWRGPVGGRAVSTARGPPPGPGLGPALSAQLRQDVPGAGRVLGQALGRDRGVAGRVRSGGVGGKRLSGGGSPPAGVPACGCNLCPSWSVFQNTWHRIFPSLTWKPASTWERSCSRSRGRPFCRKKLRTTRTRYRSMLSYGTLSLTRGISITCCKIHLFTAFCVLSGTYISVRFQRNNMLESKAARRLGCPLLLWFLQVQEKAKPHSQNLSVCGWWTKRINQRIFFQSQVAHYFHFLICNLLDQQQEKKLKPPSPVIWRGVFCFAPINGKLCQGSRLQCPAVALPHCAVAAVVWL